MDVVRIIGISLLLLLFGGCLSTPPVVPQVSEDTDPFRFALAPNPFTPPARSFFDDFDLPADDPPLSTGDMIPIDPIEYECSDDCLEDEFQFEPEVLPIITVAEQEQLLFEDRWVQNVNLINMLDTGRSLSQTTISPEERRLRDQINRLNMSPQERARRQNQQLDYVDGSLSDWRWMHRGVDRLSATPTEQRESAEIFLRNRKYRDDPKYRTLRANAAILLGRDGNANVANFLLQLVRDDRTLMNIRCAAVEVLGHMPTVTADDLIPLLDMVKEREIETTDRRTGETREQRDLGITEIWTELLIAIAEKIDPWEHACFLEPFYANSFTIRLENAKIWRRKSLQKQPSGSLPGQFLEIARREIDSQVRVEIIRTLGAWQVPGLFPILESDLRHRIAEVRNAAMQALADAGSQEAVPIIRDQLRENSGVNRAAAVSALRKLGAFDDVFRSVNDDDFRVRVEVAGAFAERRTPQTATFAKSYLSGRAEVQLATVNAIGSWSIDESGPLLLDAAKSNFTNVRRRATEILAQRGISYSGFDPEDRPANQTAQYEELVYVFREMTGVDPKNIDWGDTEQSTPNVSTIRQVSAIAPEDFALAEVRRCLDDWSNGTLTRDERQLIHRRLTAHGQRLMPLIDHLMTVENRTIPESLDRVFAEVEPMFVEIEKLRSGNLDAQQQAARKLAQLGTTDNPSNIAARRMVDLAARQSDPLVLASLLPALQNADSELVCQLARPLMRSESAAVRRVACEMLAQFGSSEDVHLLREALRDSNRAVVRGALQGIDTLLAEEETNDSSVFGALQAVLLHSDHGLQADAAATLHRLGRAEGTDALRRLAASNDAQVRLYVARVVSGLADSAFVPLLLRLLDDGNGSVRTEALKGLPRAAGQDIGRAGLNPHSDISQTQQQIDRWKAWAREK